MAGGVKESSKLMIVDSDSLQKYKFVIIFICVCNKAGYTVEVTVARCSLSSGIGNDRLWHGEEAKKWQSLGYRGK